MKTHFVNYLRFNRNERNGTLALFLLAALLFGIPEIARHFRQPEHTNFDPFKQEIAAFRQAMAPANQVPGAQSPSLFVFDPNTITREELLQLGLAEKVVRNICNYRDKGGKFRSPADFQKIWSLEKTDFERLMPYIQIGGPEKTATASIPEKTESVLFAFDPNTASEADLKRLGLPDRSVKSILNYREKGGQFRKKEDLEKIYTLSEEDYNRIADYASFPAFATSNPVARKEFSPTKFAKKQAEIIDINQASLENWQSLPGIGEMRARQLVNYREKLGGFLAVDQVGEMIGFPDSVLQAIRPYLVISSGPFRKINLNQASVADLDAHPYISKRQAELIVAYREQHGAFVSPEDIGKMRAISDKVWLAKVRPYLGI